MKRRYAAGRTKKKVLFEIELETLDKLERIQKEQILASRKKERLKVVANNPFLAMLYKSLTFNVWRSIYGNVQPHNYWIERKLAKRQKHMSLGLEREISDDEDDEDERQESIYLYETEEDLVIEDEDPAYLEHLEMEEAERADPGLEDRPAYEVAFGSKTEEYHIPE